MLAVLLTLIAQFAPIPFPSNSFLVGCCVIAYFTIQGALQLLALWEGETIAQAKAKKVTTKFRPTTRSHSPGYRTNFGPLIVLFILILCVIVFSFIVVVFLGFIYIYWILSSYNLSS